LLSLAELLSTNGNHVEEKQLTTRALKIWREKGHDRHAAIALAGLSGANGSLGLHREGIQQAREAIAIFERLGDTVEQAASLVELAYLLYIDGQLDAAEAAATRTIEMLPKKNEEFLACRSYRTLGGIYYSRGERKKGIQYYERALEIAASFGWHGQQFWIHYSLARRSHGENNFDDAHAHIDTARPHGVNRPYYQSRAMKLRARVLYRQHRHEEAMIEASQALEAFENLGVTTKVEECRELLQDIERAMEVPMVSPRK
jgi:tetratricopeptide (TPR) repeat protein